MTFYDGTTLAGTGTDQWRNATRATTTLAVGTHSISALYSGDTNYNGATSAALSQVVNKPRAELGAMPPPAITSFRSTQCPKAVSVTFTATVPAGAIGTMSFPRRDNVAWDNRRTGTVLISRCCKPTTSTLAVGTHHHSGV